MTTTVLITGASSGIGKACALRLIRAGTNVIAGVRKTTDADALRSEAGCDAVGTVLMDVTEQASIDAAAERIGSALAGRGLDGLVNVAGIGKSGPLEYMSLDELRYVFEVNFFGQFAVTKAFLPLLRKAKGRIVNMSSVGAHIAMPFAGALSASKSAFGALSDTFRQELAPFGVRVCTIEPGAIRTPAVDKTLGDVEGRIAHYPPEGARRYGELLRRFTNRALSRENNGSPPEVVAEAVFHALTSAHPHIRYIAGKDARLLSSLPRVLPDRLLDRMRALVFGIPPHFGQLADLETGPRA